MADILLVCRSMKHSKPDVSIVRCKHTGYWLINISCKDRNKLLFDTVSPLYSSSESPVMLKGCHTNRCCCGTANERSPQMSNALLTRRDALQVCTLADLDYDVYHATIKSCDGMATQEYYVRPRYGFPWDARRAEKLAAMLEASIQRRFPRGLKVHVQSVDSFGCLAALTAVLRDAGLTITRAKVPLLTLSSNPLPPRTRPAPCCGAFLSSHQNPHLHLPAASYHRVVLSCAYITCETPETLATVIQVRTNAAHNMCGHTFYVMDAGGSAPQRSTVEAACAQLGGQLMEPSPTQGPLSSSGTISFSFMGQQWRSSWGGSVGAPSHAAMHHSLSCHLLPEVWYTRDIVRPPPAVVIATLSAGAGW